MRQFRLRHFPGIRVLTAAIVALGLGTGAALAEKALSWRSLDVTARLDADGRLHVVERHVMVFTGDWNGGERIFRVLPGQKLDLEAVRRFDPEAGAAGAGGATSGARDLVRGNLGELDHYDFTDATTLRWRSRLPSDPPFDNAALGYEIAYTMSGVVLKQGDRYVLDHNFALPAANKPIETFSVDLDLDPAWTAPPGFARHHTAGPLAPGANFVVHADLARAAAGAPAAVRVGTTRGSRAAIFAVLLLATLAMGFAFYRREASLGRFREPTPPDAIDEPWLNTRLFTLLPEEAGALWDDSIGAPEVTAVLAMLTAEKKLETVASGKELTMRLKVPIGAFTGYEKDLLESLFFGGRTETSTSSIKSHYASSGFDPASKIEPGLRERLSRHADFQDRSGRPPRAATFYLFVAGVALLVSQPLLGGGAADWATIVGIVIWTAFWWVVGLIAAWRYQNRMEHLGPWALSFLVVPLVFLLFAWNGLSSAGLTPLPVLIGQLLLRLAVINNLFNVAKTRSGPRKIERRKELVAARRYFQRELARPAPRMKDAWFPWIAAFGLGPAVDHWFRSFGGAAATSLSSSAGSHSSSSSSGFSGESGGFTGGGGFSGGGGSSGSWAVAAGALAAGVSAPSSSGGGGGGGGGGSSGGGGGGGW